MNSQVSDRPKRRWMRFSLRTLLVATLVVAAYFAGRMPMVRRAELAEQQREAVTRQAEEARKRFIEYQVMMQSNGWVIQQGPNGGVVRFQRVQPARSTTVAPLTGTTVVQPIKPASTQDGVDAGMMFDALEHQQRIETKLRGAR